MKIFEKKITLLNVISNVFLQLVTVLSGFIIPKIILSYFGSNVNGLVSSINQFLNYITLIEGGISGVIMASLYKPILDNDTKKLSSIIKTSDKFYKNIGYIYILYSLLLAVFYPLFMHDFSFIFIFSLVLILSSGLLIQYMFALSYRNLLNADKKGYIVSFAATIILILSIIFAFLSVKIYPSIHFLKLLTGVLFIIQPLIYNYYVSKYYKLDDNVEVDNNLLKNRWSGFAINIAAFIHNSTDITILTIFTDLATVSVYSVYNIVTLGLKSIINAISSAIVPVVGKSYVSSNIKDLQEKFALYEYIIFLLVFLLFTIAGLLITPFVMIYTRGINDANYNQVIFGILLVLSEAIYLIKYPHLNLSYSANKFKEQTFAAFFEAIINIIVSLLLVAKFGLIGITIGTLCGMIYRMIFQVNFSQKLVKNYEIKEFYKKLILFGLFTIIGILISYFLVPKVEFNVISFIIHGIIYFLIFGILYLFLSLIFFQKEIKYIKNYLKR